MALASLRTAPTRVAIHSPKEHPVHIGTRSTDDPVSDSEDDNIDLGETDDTCLDEFAGRDGTTGNRCSTLAIAYYST